MDKKREKLDVTNPKGTPYVKMNMGDYMDIDPTTGEIKDLGEELNNTGLPTKGQVDSANTSIQDLVEGLNYEYDDPRE
ncbi:MAG: hypothetical protein KID00_03410 [Clostridium argentinense]|uniref:Uncharacterized protein n=1 Tax=Clostridium faecium TaxID=2762223 RepID=A0ABR8YVE6_9CLOT|nr:hypothetical protein [Clostridium faecium]MBD8048258.1 hypothetical protein [Clostridium faecium]MBS5822902.1 hypothetical protein [Clostridium argentinense]MDU1349085.1 hypothetical protein [Clostridium argentinense]